jgi:hypothetical protein
MEKERAEKLKVDMGREAQEKEKRKHMLPVNYCALLLGPRCQALPSRASIANCCARALLLLDYLALPARVRRQRTAANARRPVAQVNFITNTSQSFEVNLSYSTASYILVAAAIQRSPNSKMTGRYCNKRVSVMAIVIFLMIRSL